MISGEIRTYNGEPLLGATITIDNKSRVTVTNIDGKYVFEKINIGKHIVTASYVGFKTKTKEITVIENKNNNLNFRLEEKNEVLDEVKIKSISKKTKKETKGFAVNVIKTKEASVRNIQTNELLNTTAGVKIRQNGGLGSHTHYSLNGLSGSSISIFIDGIPISMYGSSFSLNSIPPSMIENIEVYKGVVPGHLADDALGGVINIVMKKGVKSNLNASVSYGSFNTFQASINGLYRAKKSGFTLKTSGFYNYSDNNYKVWGGNVKHIEVDGNEVPITAKRFNDAYKSIGGMVQVGFINVKWADQFLIGFNASDDYKEIQHGAFMTKHPYKGRFVESDALLKNLTYLKKDLITKGLDININALLGKRNTFVSDTVSYAYTWLGVRQQRPVDFSDIYGPSIDLIRTDRSQQEGGPTLFNINRKVSSIRSGISYKINKQHKVLLNHFYSGLDREDSDEILPLLENTFKQTSDLHKNIYSLSYELNAFRKKLKVNVFGKHYQQKVLNTSPEFNENATEVIDIIYKADKNYNGYGGTISYAITPNIILLASTEKAIRMPNETEVFGDTGENVIANLAIKPEISYNYNLGFRLGSFTIKKHEITVSSSLFSRNIKDLIGFPSTDDDDELVQYENFNNQTTSKGIDGQLNYTYNNNFKFNFNISKLTLKTENSFGMVVDIPNTPLFTMNGSIRYSINNFMQKKSHLNLFYNAYFTDEFSSIMQRFENNAGLEKYIIPTQFLQDIGCSYTFPKEKFVLSFDVKNIFNERAFDNRSVQKPGRAFYLKLNYTINKF
jgi:outer membrane receptor protein involved in Fe transport